MKKKAKTIGVLLTGIALAVGIAVSGGVIHNSHVVDEARAASQTATLVTNVSQLSSGDNIVITNIIGDKALSTTQGSNNRSSQSVTLNGSLLSFDDSTTEIITLGTSNSHWTLYANTTPGYLYAASSSKNYLRTQSTNDANGEWTIELNGDSEATIEAQGTNTRNLLQYNTSATLFACYSSGQEPVKIFKIDSAKEFLSLSVSGTLAKTLYYAGESFDSAGLTINANYSDSSTADVTSECTFSPDPLTAGVTSVTASYTEDEVTKTVNIGGFSVSTRSVTSISVLTNPTKTSYTIGQSFDPTGMKIRAVYSVGPTNDDYVAYIYSPTSVFDSVGEKTITITSTENASAMTTLNVDVVAVSSLNITIADTGYTGTSYATTAKTFTKSDVEFSMVNFLKPSGTSNMQFRTGTTDAFSFHNSIALPGIITKVTVQNVSGSPSSMTLYTGVSTQASSTSGGIAATFNSSDKTFSWDVNTAEQSKYLRLFNFTGSEACIFSNIEIEFFAEPEANEDAIAWGTDFLSATAAGCSALDQSQLLTAWNGLETSYNALSSEAKGYLTSLTPNEAGNDAEHAVARYLYIITKYGDVTFNDFMNLGISSSSNNTYDIGDNTPNVAIILIVSLVGASVLVGYRLMPKKKED